MRKNIVIVLLLSFIITCSKQNLTTRSGAEILTRTVTVNNKVYDYYVYLPPQYTSSKKWPVILYLHGSGQNGNVWQISSGLGRALRQYPDRYPCIVVIPECPFTRYWIGDMITYAMKALDKTVEEFNGDKQRLYSSGVSMGGYGTLISAVRHPEKFAALAPVCGGVIPPVEFSQKDREEMAPICIEILESSDPYKALAQVIGKTPTWLFHGSEDNLIPVSESKEIVAALEAIDGSVKYKEYKNMGHGIWDIVFLEPDFPTWLFAQRLK